MRVGQLMKELERKIRMNKAQKDRAEKIKIQTLTQTLRAANLRNGTSKSPRVMNMKVR